MSRMGFKSAWMLLWLLVLSGCGFTLRQEIELPPQLHQIKVQVSDVYSPLQHNLEQALIRAGARKPGVGQPAAVLRILRNSITREPLTVGSTGRVQEYGMRYVVTMQLDDAEGHPVVARQDILLERSYQFDSTQAQGTPGEEEVVRIELEREMIQAILRRIDAVLSQR